MQTACGINPDNKIQCFGTDDVTGDTPDTLRQGQASPPDGKYTQVGVGDTPQLIASSTISWFLSIQAPCLFGVFHPKSPSCDVLSIQADMRIDGEMCLH